MPAEWRDFRSRVENFGKPNSVCNSCIIAPMFDPDTIVSPRLKRLHAYWTAKCGSRPMPSRADIDPVEMPWILGNLSLIEVRGEGDYLWRLDGSNLTAFFGCEMTGRSISEYPYPAFIGKMRATLDDAVRAGGPSRSVRRFSSKTQKWDYESLYLPLSGDGQRIDMLMQALEIDPR